MLREDIVKLLVYSVTTPAPNIAHLLLGYDITKPLQETNLQDPGENDADILKVIDYCFIHRSDETSKNLSSQCVSINRTY